MKVGLLQEGDISTGETVAQRYQDLIEEVALADRLGFSSWGTSEQHFSPPRFTVSAPEVLYAAIAAHTERIVLRLMAAVLLQWNHPILVAERIATLDIVSGGRAEITTARSNNMTTLEAFGVDPSTTKAQWAESMEILAQILATGEIEHQGEFWTIPHRAIVPRPLQTPHPALSVAASSIASHADAGRRGLGVIGYDNYFGWDYLQACIDAYRDGLTEGGSLMPQRNETLGLFVSTACCAETREEAQAISRDVALGYFEFIGDLYRPLALQPGYEYLDEVNRIADNTGNLDFLLTETPSVMIGTPDDFIARLRELEERGVDEVLLRVDGIGHENQMRTLELIGREVIPAVDVPVVVEA